VPAVKEFPIGPLGGLDYYLGENLNPLPMPTGGVGVDDAGAYPRAGAAAIGVSRALVESLAA
jgi:2-dehydro-3-deoxyphosphogluconate aldolase/(4S)-4-hydroxy-2-oxoglutarate aldolase